MKTRFFLLTASLFLFAFIFSSCLTCEKKQYTFKFDGKDKGTLTVKYINIMSKYDSEDLSKAEEIKKDFDELINDYINGDKKTESFPDAKFVTSKLFEEAGNLCGEVVFEFSNLEQVKLFQADKNSPYMFLISTFSFETFLSSNGTKAPEFFPAVYWDKKSKNLELTTKVDDPDETTTSLLAKWKASK